jgi:hypothetical protein
LNDVVVVVVVVVDDDTPRVSRHAHALSDARHHVVVVCRLSSVVGPTHACI